MPPECPTLFAPRREHSISRDSLDNSLRRSLVPALSLSLSFSYCPSLSLAQVGSAALKRAYTYTRNAEASLYILAFLLSRPSLSPSHARHSSVSSSSPRLTRPRQLLQPTWPTRAFFYFSSFFFCIQLGCSVSAHCHESIGESQGITRTKPMCVICPHC